MQTQVSGPTFTFDGKTFTAPAAGSFRVAFFNEAHPRFGGEFSVPGTAASGGDLNRDGDETDKFYVLWNPTSNAVYVDVDQDNSFADEPAMTDYKVNRDIRKFGTDNPATAVKEEVPFVVQTDGKNKFVNLGIVAGAHASHVAGIAAGNALFGGQMSGAAPGAKIVSSRACLWLAGCFAHALNEGMIEVAKQENVDVINMSIGGLPALNDGNNARCVTYARLIEQFNVQMFISMGNDGPGVNTAGDPGLCDKVVGVGASITKQTYLDDYGIQKSYQDSLLYFSSRGPREDGGFQPLIVAPGAAVSSFPMWQPGSGLPYALPPGYALANGTSMAAPQSTGAAALMISAAKATGVQHQPAQLRQAITSTARFITEPENDGSVRLQPFDQGNGLFNVEAAWTMLSGAAGGIKTVDITSSVATSTVLGSFLAIPNTGPGIYDRESPSAIRQYTFTRTSGGGGAITYNVSWFGGDGTFASPATISLARNQPTTLNVTVNPATPGVHSAILRLDDPATAGVDYATLNTVIKSHDLSASPFSQTVSGDIDIAQQEHHFFRVPTGTPILKVDMTGGSTAAGTGQMRFLRWTPWGLPADSNAVSNCYNPPAAAGCGTGSPTSRTVLDPIPGVWEVSVDARRSSDADNAPYSVTASLLGATVSPDPDDIPSATIGTPLARSYTITNKFGAFTGRAVGHVARERTPRAVHDREPRDADVRGRGSERCDAAAGHDRQPVGSGRRPRSVRAPAGRNDGGPVGRRRLRGVGHDRQPRRGHVEGRRRRLRGPGRLDVVRVRRRLPQDAVVRIGLGHGRERPAARRRVVDGARLGAGRRGARLRPGAVRQRRGADGHEHPRRQRRRHRAQRLPLEALRHLVAKGPAPAGPFRTWLIGAGGLTGQLLEADVLDEPSFGSSSRLRLESLVAELPALLDRCDRPAVVLRLAAPLAARAARQRPPDPRGALRARRAQRRGYRKGLDELAPRSLTEGQIRARSPNYAGRSSLGDRACREPLWITSYSVRLLRESGKSGREQSPDLVAR